MQSCSDRLPPLEVARRGGMVESSDRMLYRGESVVWARHPTRRGSRREGRQGLAVTLRRCCAVILSYRPVPWPRAEPRSLPLLGLTPLRVSAVLVPDCRCLRPHPPVLLTVVATRLVEGRPCLLSILRIGKLAATRGEDKGKHQRDFGQHARHVAAWPDPRRRLQGRATP